MAEQPPPGTITKFRKSHKHTPGALEREPSSRQKTVDTQFWNTGTKLGENVKSFYSHVSRQEKPIEFLGWYELADHLKSQRGLTRSDQNLHAKSPQISVGPFNYNLYVRAGGVSEGPHLGAAAYYWVWGLSLSQLPAKIRVLQRCKSPWGPHNGSFIMVCAF